MNDVQYDELTDAVLLKIEEALDKYDESEDVDIDYESADGMLTMIFVNGSKIIINKQPPLQQIWVATKFNGHHFNLEGDVWIDERTGVEFWSFINEASSKQAEMDIVLG